MSRKAKQVLGPIATKAAQWPPLRRRSDDDQTKLEQLLNLELDAWRKGIAQEEGVSEEEHAKKERKDRQGALWRADRRDMEMLKRFVANSIGPDGKRLGEEIANFVQYQKRAKPKKTRTDYLHEAQAKGAIQKKTEAVWEANRAKALLVRVYGRTPDNYTPRTDLIVAANRAGVSQQVIKDWDRDRRCPADLWPITSPDELGEWASKVAMRRR